MTIVHSAPLRRRAALSIVTVLLPALALVLGACSGSEATPAPAAETPAEEVSLVATSAEASPPPGEALAPDFTGVDVVTGRTVSLGQYEGTTVLVNFVNYGCSSSLNRIVSDQLLAIRALSDQRGDFIPLSVFCGCCPPDALRDFAEQNGMTWPWVLDVDNTIVRLYQDHLRQYGYPTLVLIDGGQLISEVAGYADLDRLDAMIGGLATY